MKAPIQFQNLADGIRVIWIRAFGYTGLFAITRGIYAPGRTLYPMRRFTIGRNQGN